MFFVPDKITRYFLALHQPFTLTKEAPMPIAKISCNQPIRIFLQSVLACFDNPLSGNPAFLQNKLFELLFNLSVINPNLIRSFAQFTTFEPVDLTKMMETNFKENLTLEEFAYKAGRSLASFKRDFQKVYNTSPHRWLITKRLDYARHLIENTDVRITDACYDSGFESVAHFSKAFKSKYGVMPSVLRTS